MAYSKTVWNNNTPPDISAENLNKMEQGIYDAQFPDGGSTGQILSKTNDGTGWVDAPTSAEWGNITGQLSEQTDLYSELESKITMPSGGTTGQVLTKTASGEAWQTPSGGGNVDTVNSIQPDANKNVQTVVELTQAQYDALVSPDPNVEYFITDGNNNPANNTVMASGVAYDNTDSGMTATNVQDAVDELNAGLMSEFTQIGTATLNTTTQRSISLTSGHFSDFTDLLCIVDDTSARRGSFFIPVSLFVTGKANHIAVYVADVLRTAVFGYVDDSTFSIRITSVPSDVTLTFRIYAK